jgi:hypothetical protein
MKLKLPVTIFTSILWLGWLGPCNAQEPPKTLYWYPPVATNYTKAKVVLFAQGILVQYVTLEDIALLPAGSCLFVVDQDQDDILEVIPQIDGLLLRGGNCALLFSKRAALLNKINDQTGLRWNFMIDRKFFNVDLKAYDGKSLFPVWDKLTLGFNESESTCIYNSLIPREDKQIAARMTDSQSGLSLVTAIQQEVGPGFLAVLCVPLSKEHCFHDRHIENLDNKTALARLAQYLFTRSATDNPSKPAPRSAKMANLSVLVSELTKEIDRLQKLVAESQLTELRRIANELRARIEKE